MNFSVQITAEQDALKVRLKVEGSFTQGGSCDLLTCYTLTDRNKQVAGKMANLTFHLTKNKNTLMFSDCLKNDFHILRVPSGAVLVSATSKECRDSDADLDVDGDDTLEYGRAQYPYNECNV